MNIKNQRTSRQYQSLQYLPDRNHYNANEQYTRENIPKVYYESSRNRDQGGRDISPGPPGGPGGMEEIFVLTAGREVTEHTIVRVLVVEVAKKCSIQLTKEENIIECLMEEKERTHRIHRGLLAEIVTEAAVEAEIDTK